MRRILLGSAGIVAVLTLGGYLALPWITVAATQRACPLTFDHGAACQGAGWDHAGPAGAVLVTIAPATTWTLATAASGRWFPRRCLAAGQVLWGIMPGGAPWRMALADSATIPSITGSLTAAQGAALMAAVRPPGAPVDVGLRALHLRSLPPGDDVAQIAYRFSGHLTVAGFQVDIEHLAGRIVLHTPLRAEVQVDELRLVGGDGDVVRPMVSQALTRGLNDALRQAPPWVPWASAIDLRLGAAWTEL